MKVPQFLQENFDKLLLAILLAASLVWYRDFTREILSALFVIITGNVVRGKSPDPPPPGAAVTP
jgi:hypothetical protein